MRFQDVLEATTGRDMKISDANIEKEGAILLDLADIFKEISFRPPVLSVYELRDTENCSTSLPPKHQRVSLKPLVGIGKLTRVLVGQP